jgi:hypothetical protein
MKLFVKLAIATSVFTAAFSSANAYDYATYSAMMTAPTQPTTVTTTYPTTTTYPIPTVEPTPTTTCTAPTVDFDIDEYEIEYGTTGDGCMTMAKGAPKKKICVLTLAGNPPTSVNKGKQTKADCDTLCKGQTNPKCVSFTWGQ